MDMPAENKDNRIRVLQLINNMNDGGAERQVVGIVSCLDRERFDPYILNIHYVDSANMRRLEEAGVPTCWVFPGWTVPVRAFNKLTRKTYAAKRILRFVRKEKIDVIHAHLDCLPYLVPIAGGLSGVPILYTCHNEPRVMLPEGGINYDSARFLFGHNRFRMIALHREMEEQLNGLFGTDSTVTVPNGVDTEKFMNIKMSGQEAKKRLGIPVNAFVVGIVARFSQQKNYDFMMEIFGCISERNPDAFLLTVGSGPDKDIVTELINEKIPDGHCLMLEHRTDMPEIYRAMDVFVLPSKYEGMPLVAIEAQASGVVTCLSDRITDAAVISDYAVKSSLSESADSWAETILDAYCRLREKASGKEIPGLEKYSFREQVRRLEDLYEQETKTVHKTDYS